MALRKPQGTRDLELGRPYFLGFKPFALDSRRTNLEPIRGELVIDLSGGASTKHLASTCYGVAVKDCLRIQGDIFRLEVRPDLRPLLLSQLREHYGAYRVYRTTEEPEKRTVPTGEMLVKFVPGASLESKWLGVAGCFEGLSREDDIQDGVYRLAGKFSTDPIVAYRAIDFYPIIPASLALLGEIDEAREAWANRGAHAEPGRMRHSARYIGEGLEVLAEGLRLSGWSGDLS